MENNKLYDSLTYCVINNKLPIHICDICDKWNDQTIANIECYLDNIDIDINNIKKYLFETDYITIEYLIEMAKNIRKFANSRFCILKYNFPIFKIKNSLAKYNVSYEVIFHNISNVNLEKIIVEFTIDEEFKINDLCYSIKVKIDLTIDDYQNIITKIENIYIKSLNKLNKNKNIIKTKEQLITNLTKYISLIINNKYKNFISQYNIEISSGEFKSILKKYL